MSGGNEKSNIAVLTAREHFICHILLTKMTEGKNKAKMVFAARCMGCFKNKHHKRYVNARLYEAIKKIPIQVTVTEETKCKISKKLKNTRMKEENPFYNKTHSNEQKAKWSKERKGRKLPPLTDEHKKKISVFRKGRYTGKDNGMYGKTHTKESIEKMKEKATGKKQTQETINKNIKSRNKTIHSKYKRMVPEILTIQSEGIITYKGIARELNNCKFRTDRDCDFNDGIVKRILNFIEKQKLN